MQRRAGWVAVVSGAMLGACAVSEPTGTNEPLPEQETFQLGDECTPQGCGENSPVIDGLEFHDAHLFGVANVQGFAIEPRSGRAQIRKGLSLYDLNVVNGVITGSRNNVTKLAGQALKGGVISFVRGLKHYQLVIADVRTMEYFVPPRTTTVEAYKLQWTEVGGSDTPKDLCKNVKMLLGEGLGNPGHDPGQMSQTLMRMTPWEAVVFEGDRINANAKTMSQVADDAWFNIGCAGSALAKLLLTHHTIHSQSPTELRPWQQRQAMLKMYVADYCGNGTSFTVARQKLVWHSPMVDYLFPPWKLEAPWNENGAMCLYAPRMLYPSTPIGPIRFPDIWNQINAVCNPTQCTNPDPYGYPGAERVSANLHP